MRSETMYVGLNTNLSCHFLCFTLYWSIVVCHVFIIIIIFNFKFSYFIREVKRIHDKVVNVVQSGINLKKKKKMEYKKWVALGNHNIVLFTVKNIRLHT